ncbi:mechanosensitive ion channel family protein [Pseudomonas leptonychotis]|uniref:Small-conductance mechanosensitive channel n=1 Tax=Pseudomonas leptonychotis TaxID=2448482 RepID=A0A4T2A5P7_9PSED|nr:mechanosensitive ion channel family protein [Pseudomonas leptonychotis]TIH10406.1 BON domain-containing protein [Pseudomonas leptonychotis]
MKRRTRTPRHTLLVLALLVGLLPGEHILAQAEDAPAAPESVVNIDAEAAESDEKIRSRIENIFAELEPLREVSVYVGEGVVILRGEVANEVAAQQAERLASRLAGVVTVTDEMSRTLAVADNVRPVLERLRTQSLNFIKALPLIGLALLVLTVFILLGNFLAGRQFLWRKIAPNPFLADLMAQATRVVILLLGIILALNLLGAAAVITTILGGAGVIGLAIGFAVRDTVENYISSVMLSLRQPFRAKDHVVINDLEGIVVRLTSRATILMTLDGNHMRIPNAAVFKGIILNYSTNPERRFEFELGVDAEDDPVAGMKAGLDAIRTLDFILQDPEPDALINTVGDSNIVLTFYAWIDQRETNFGKARSLAIRAAMRALEEQGFTLPEPIYRLRFDPEVNTALFSALDGKNAGVTPLASGEDKNDSAATRVKRGDAVLDVTPDKHLEQKVDAEIRSDQGNDLLDKDVPHE